MGSPFHQLCPRYSGTLTPTAPMAIRLWDTFTFLPSLNYLLKHWNTQKLIIFHLGQTENWFTIFRVNPNKNAAFAMKMTIFMSMEV